MVDLDELRVAAATLESEADPGAVVGAVGLGVVAVRVNGAQELVDAGSDPGEVDVLVGE